MTEPTPRWQDLQEEALRPLPRADRRELLVCWLEWPGAMKRRKGLRGMTDEEVDWLTRALLEELSQRSEGRLAAARLLAKYGGGADDDGLQAGAVG